MRMVARRIGWWRVLWNDTAASLFFFKFAAVALILAILVLTDEAKGKRTTPLPFEKRKTQAIWILGVVVSPCLLVGFLRAAWIKGKLERAIELQGVVEEVNRARRGRRVVYTYSYGGQAYRGAQWLSGDPRVDRGAEVGLLVDPDRPWRSYIKARYGL